MSLKKTISNNNTPWLLSQYREYITNTPTVKACGSIIIDPNYKTEEMKKGAFGAIIDVVDENGHKYVLRLSANEESFVKHLHIFTVINTIVRNATSPCFKSLKTAFKIDVKQQVQTLPKLWKQIIFDAMVKLNCQRGEGQLVFLLIQRAEIGNMIKFVTNW